MLQYRPKGGIGQYSLNLLRAMSRLPEVGPGVRIDVLQMRADGEQHVPDRRFRRVGMWTPPHNRFEQAGMSVELLKVRPRPQLLHSPDFVPPRFRLFPAVVNIQDLAFVKFPEMTLLTEESKRYYDQVPWAAHNAEALIALSESARNDMIAMLHVNPNKVVVIPGAANEGFRPPEDREAVAREVSARFELPAPKDGGYILFVSTIEPRKNLPTLLEAYSRVRDLGGVRAWPALALVGSKGWLYEKVDARIAELHLQDCVRFLGGVEEEDLIRLYQGARAFALPSLYEGFGLPALEAMACAVPVLASNAGSLPEVVGGAGMLLDPQDVDAWAEAIERVLLDPEEERRLREAGPRQAACFSWDEAARRTWQLYGKVIAS
jgi:glycosyltransferase involved in cell wall biosynthesis